MGFLAVLREQAIIQKMKATASAVRKADTVMVQRGMVFFWTRVVGCNLHWVWEIFSVNIVFRQLERIKNKIF